MKAQIADGAGLQPLAANTRLDSRDLAATAVVVYREPIHPLHAIFLAFPLPLYLSAWLSDLVYTKSFQVQWLNFSQWVMVGALLLGGFALLWSLVDLVRSRPADKGRHATYFVLLLVTFVLGFINELIHAKDAFATMPAGLYMSFIVTLFALGASWIGYSGFRTVEVQ
jgi:uncharacterized membrane protein